MSQQEGNKFCNVCATFMHDVDSHQHEAVAGEGTPVSYINIKPEPIDELDESNTFKCTLCDELFDEEENLDRHIQEHLKNTNVKREMTDKEISTQNNYEGMIGARDVKSETIGFVLSTSDVKMEPEDENTAKLSSPSTKVKSSSKDNSVQARPHQCSICDKRFSRRQNLMDHVNTHTGARPYKCNLCDKSYRDVASFQRHEKTHTGEKPHECSVCEKAFIDKKGLKEHMRKHTGEKPFSCDICGQCFSGRSSLRNHKIQHDSEYGKPFECTECGTRFTQRASLDTHMLKHTGEKPYKCSMCDEAFTRKTFLTTHERIHKGEKPFRCQACRIGFLSQGELNIHKRVHHDVFYDCKTCGLRLTKRYSLKVHERTHTGEKPFACDLCDKAFTTGAKLNTHKKVHVRQMAAKESQKVNEVQAQTQQILPSLSSDKQYLITGENENSVLNGPLGCKVCGMLCSSEKLLEHHMETTEHIVVQSENNDRGENSVNMILICKMCETKFKSTETLKEHMPDCMLRHGGVNTDTKE